MFSSVGKSGIIQLARLEMQLTKLDPQLAKSERVDFILLVG